MASVGLWGGSGGSPWNDGSDYDGIKLIKIFSGDCVDSISVIYDKNGVQIAGGKHGGNGGSQADIKLQPDEYLVGASGHYGILSNIKVVRSLTFQSNKQTYGPFGTEEGTHFSLPVYRGRIVSFFGLSGVYLDAIGFHIASD